MQIMSDNTPKETSRQQQTRVRREQILDTALGLFATYGFAATSTKQIAIAAGISEGLVFRYFPNKASILHALAKERDALAQAMQEILIQSTDLAVPIVLERLAAAWMEVTRSEMNFMSMLISEGQINSDVRAILQGAIDETVNGLVQYLELRVQAGEIRPTAPLPTVAANFLAALLLFFIRYRHLDDGQWNEKAHSFRAELLDTWLRGVHDILHTP